MSAVQTLRELFVHNDWGRDKVLALAAGLSDEQLDRPFEMGPGSLRATLRHLYGAERIWFERWQGAEQPRFPRSSELESPDEVWTAFRELAASRNAYLDGLSDAALRRKITYTDRQGRTCAFGLGDLMMHVWNHGGHHRAQVLNMLRHVGVKPPMLDYLFMRGARPTLELASRETKQRRAMGFDMQDGVSPPVPLELQTIRRHFRYGDWACGRLFAIAETLNDKQLDWEFEIGVGSLRKTLLHIRDAEQSWYQAWTVGPQGFEQLPDTTSVRELTELFSQTADQRDAFLDGLKNEELQRVVEAQVTPDVCLRFRLGETMLELLGHGTHHRAQTLNMLRRLGSQVPPLDYTDWLVAGG